MVISCMQTELCRDLLETMEERKLLLGCKEEDNLPWLAEAHQSTQLHVMKLLFVMLQQ